MPLFDQFKYLNVLLFDLLLCHVVQITIKSSKSLLLSGLNQPLGQLPNDRRKLSRSKARARSKSRRSEWIAHQYTNCSQKMKSNQRAVKRIQMPRQIYLPKIQTIKTCQ